MTGKLTIVVNSDVCGYTFEKLEDRIRDLLEEEGIDAKIEDFVTGNITVTRKEEMGRKKEVFDKDIKGVLILGDKIWFNDDLRCRLRICGWSKEQQEKLRRSKYVDLTLINPKEDGTAEVCIHISEFRDKKDEKDE